MDSSTPLIVGAGPVGLAAALFLARQDVRCRIIDAADAPSPYSKALAVNPRTLQILEPTGITEQMLSIGMRVIRGCFWKENHIAAEIAIDQLQHKYPFMLALSQRQTVRLLEEALNRFDVHVQRGAKLVHCRQAAESVEAEVEIAGKSQTLQAPWLLAADGAHSTVRHELGIEFAGSSFEHPWFLMDVPLKMSLPENAAHIRTLPGGGFRFLFRVIGDPQPTADPLWRVIGDSEELLQSIPDAQPAGSPVWTSSFRIAHRINDRMQDGRVYFAGDAAHVHSPIGARGMNLGIEDAWVFSELYKQNRLDEYGSIRRKVDRRVVRRIEMVSRIVLGESTISRALRSTVVPLVMHLAPASQRMLRIVTGLDHPLAM